VDAIDFPTWLSLGTYGGLGCSLLTSGVLAAYALGRRRGTPRQLARATLLCLGASALSLVPIWWRLSRFDVYGPSLSTREILLVLLWCVGCGWCLPLGALVRYIARAKPLPAGQGFSLRMRAVVVPHLASLNDPARRIEPLGTGRAWGQLVPLDGELAERPLPLTRQLTLLGREVENDIIISDEKASRYHAEIHWDHGHPQLLDRASMNGTRLNAEPVRGSVPLRPNDVIEVGERRYRFELLAVEPGLAAGAGNPATPIEETRKIAGVSSGGPTPSAPPDGGLRLIGVNRGFEFTRWELRDPVSVIGRDPECQVRLADSSVSRRHAQIVRQQSGFFVSDLGSSNGTTLNGALLATPAPVHAGDLLGIGEVTLRCEAAPAFLGTVDHSAPTRSFAGDASVEDASTSPAPAALANERSAPTAPPQRAPQLERAGPLTALLHSMNTGRPASRQSAPRLVPPRLRGGDPPADGRKHGR
jgi:pSer/pThr/pTyr-binding forkhead associated (FHA) protein